MDIAGKKFGMLLVIRRGENSNQGLPRWICLCDCGREHISWQASLVNGRAKTCGCTRMAALRASRISHGHATDREHTPEYGAWSNMIQRCQPGHERAEYYSEMGVSVCDRWRDFDAFLLDMGHRPTEKHSLDRYPDKDGSYEPGNVRWATQRQQAGNRRNCIMVDVGGIEVCLKEASRLLGKNYDAVRHRIYKGFSPEEALRL